MPSEAQRLHVRGGMHSRILSFLLAVLFCGDVVRAQSVPGAPQNLSAFVSADGRVFLSWSSVSGPVTTYVVEVGSAPGSSNLAVFMTGNATPGFNASAVPPGTYFVRVRAGNASGVGPASNEVRVDVLPSPCVAPRPPTSLTATVAGTSVTLGWSIDVSVTSIVLEAGTAPSLSNVFVGHIGRRTSITATAAPGTYAVRVRAQNACGALSDPSNEISVTVLGSADITINFSGLTTHESPLGTYTESGFTVAPTAANWVSWTTYGNPAPAAIFHSTGRVTGELTITAGGGGFTFTAADLYSSTTRIPYTFVGLANSTVVFSESGELPNTFGRFVTVVNPHRDMKIDTLIIRLDNNAVCCTNPMGIDNIVVRY